MIDGNTIGWHRNFHGMVGVLALALVIVLYGFGMLLHNIVGAILIISSIILTLYAVEGLLWQFSRFQVKRNEVAQITLKFWGVTLLFVYVLISGFILFGMKLNLSVLFGAF